MPAAVFDLDGTLLRSSALDDRCFTAALISVYGDIFPTPIDFGREPEFTDQAIAYSLPTRAGATVTSDTVQAHHDAFIAEMTSALRREPDSCPPIAGALQVLNALAEAGWGVAIATGSWRKSASLKLSASGLDAISIPVITSTDETERVGLVRRALSMLDADPSECVCLGDGPWDGTTAQRVGGAFVGITGGGGDRGLLERHGAAAVLHDYSDTNESVATIAAALSKA
ncbi:MAG: HAD family hydrolase [Planctomycetota bacterium]